jgi:hypothetical protein
MTRGKTKVANEREMHGAACSILSRTFCCYLAVGLEEVSTTGQFSRPWSSNKLLSAPSNNVLRMVLFRQFVPSSLSHNKHTHNT